LSGTTRVSRYQKGKTNLDFTEARDSDRQWRQLGHVQVCTFLQTDNHSSTPLLSFLQAGCSSCCPSNSVKALKDRYYSVNFWGLFCSDADLFAAGDMVVPATPGSMLKSPTYSSRSGSATDVSGDWLSLQRQVAKLTCRVERLEEENGRRRQREYLLLYPLLFGYCIVQLARFLLSRSK